MFYLSQLLGKTVYFEDRVYGKIVDMAIFENRPSPPVSKIEIRHGGKKLTISPDSLFFTKGRINLQTNHIPQLPYDHKDFYLAEDLLDKQVIDIDGRRLVRVNDVVLEKNGELKVMGIDIGFDGILRRLGLGRLHIDQRILPWEVIEAFDYETGTVRIKVKQNNLNKLHPADIADILEDAGTKERLGIVQSLDARQAARALEETDEETQVSILDGLTPHTFKEIINKMHISEIADVFNDLNPIKIKEIQTVLGVDKLQKVQKLSRFSDNVAGGMMQESFFSADSSETVKEVLNNMQRIQTVPETVVVSNGGGKFVGIVYTKDLLITDKLSLLKDIISDRKFVFLDTNLDTILHLFAQYNLRVLTVIDKEKKPIGIISIDEIFKLIHEQEEKDEEL